MYDEQFKSEVYYIVVFFSCASTDVGFTGGVYRLLLAPRCWWHGMILHELGQCTNLSFGSIHITFICLKIV